MAVAEVTRKHEKVNLIKSAEPRYTLSVSSDNIKKKKIKPTIIKESFWRKKKKVGKLPKSKNLSSENRKSKTNKHEGLRMVRTSIPLMKKGPRCRTEKGREKISPTGL